MPPSPPPSPLPPWTTYRIGRGETGVLTHKPYKSTLLPLWRFKTPSIAHTSSAALWTAFLDYEAANDFVGMDMARKFLQMGMTRAKRYANHKGGRKYGAGGRTGGKVIAVGEGRKEKEEASVIFREVWERVRSHKGYLEMKAEFLRRQREWDRKRETGDGVGDGKGNRKRNREEAE